MISYKVVYTEVSLILTEDLIAHLASIQSDIETGKFNPVKSVSDILLVECSKAGKAVNSERTFLDKDPLQARRASLSYCDSLIEVSMEGLTNLQNVCLMDPGPLKTAGAKWMLLHEGKEIMLRSFGDSITIDHLKNMEREFILFDAHGFDIGGDGPFLLTVPEANYQFALIPDEIDRLIGSEE